MMQARTLKITGVKAAPRKNPGRRDSELTQAMHREDVFLARLVS
jgi:hypothetical protein